ncbi:hypothetical protein MUK42_13245 [Musa troglodytarum]|uniref:Uncharacterized protein n=1 Tax=Musa troglodytarum TaxID=320322 RepID=A0A9E7JCB4_9LILI|nr:hypothetical protein MUK42_13245 [Musa troglodytarum]
MKILCLYFNQFIIIQLKSSICVCFRIALTETVPMQVDRNLVYSDRMRVVKPSKLTMQGPQSDKMLFVELDSSVEGSTSSAQIQEKDLDMTGFGATLCSL